MTAPGWTQLLGQTWELWRQNENDRQRLLDDTCQRLALLVAEDRWSAQDVLAVAVAGGRQGWPTQLLGVCVAAARRRGASWREVGEAFGISRQAAHQRFVLVDGAAAPAKVRVKPLRDEGRADRWTLWKVPDSVQVPVEIFELALRSLSAGQKAFATRLLRLIETTNNWDRRPGDCWRR